MYLISEVPSFLFYTVEITGGPNDILYVTKFNTVHDFGPYVSAGTVGGSSCSK